MRTGKSTRRGEPLGALRDSPGRKPAKASRSL
jgi:hypothetical protein